MRSLLSIVIVTLRGAARSKLVLALSVAMGVLALALPFALSGDGTPEGQARIAMQYTAAIGMVVLSLASLWMASAGISADIRTRTLQLVRVKPVPMGRLWFGKWIAYLLLDAALLAGFLLLLWARISFEHGGGVFQRPSRTVRPDLPAIEEQARTTYERAVAGNDLSREERKALRSQIRLQIPYATATLSKGETWRWRFELPRPIRPGEPLSLRFHFDSDSLTRHGIAAECALRPQAGGASVPFRLEDFSAREITLPLESAPLAGKKRLVLEIRHAGAEGSGPIMVQPRQDLVLLQPAGSFAGNLLRAYLLLLAILSALLAIGLSLGALFTFPVAIFCAVAFLVTLLVGRYVAADPDILSPPDPDAHEPPVVAWTRLSATATSRALTFLSRPALDPAPVAELSAGEWIAAGPLLRSLLFNLVLLPLLCSLALSRPLSRKELPE